MLPIAKLEYDDIHANLHWHFSVSYSLLAEVISKQISITGLGALSAIGETPAEHRTAIHAKQNGLKPLAHLLGNKSPFADISAGWISDRKRLTHRKWSPTTMAALHVAGTAIAEANWTSQELADAALIVGTSRGNAAGWLGEWPGRRGFKLMAASNTIHSEPATAISIEHKILGPNHVIASGCSAGLDALGLGELLLSSGKADRALIVAVDLPLVPLLLENYQNSELLGTGKTLQPFAENTDGFLPGEGAAAIALSVKEPSKLALNYFDNNSDGAHPVGVPADGGRTHLLLQKAETKFGKPSAIVPHATGTQVQRNAELKIYREYLHEKNTSFHLLKPYFGHTIGASGLLESAVLLEFMKHSELPPNLEATENSTTSFPSTTKHSNGAIYKLSHGMGGHNALAVFQRTTP